MEKFSFFNDVHDDRVYYAEDWATHLKKYFTNGIFNNELNVLANNDMTITIKEGDANIEGYRYTNTGDLVKTIDNADGTLNRIDNVVLRLDLTNRLISAQIIKGTFADKPVAPELVRTSTIYDLRLAKISIPAGTTTITQDLITDTRFITSDCGNVISTVQTPDTENLFIQMQTLFEKQINELNNNFEIWFDSIKNQLDSDAAGNLQNQINNLNSNKVDNAKYDLDSNNLQLLANGKNVGDSVHIPTGITDTATGEEDLKIVNNKGIVKFSLGGKTEQKTYTGKNILDYVSNLKASSDGLTSVINDDGSITTSGKPSSNYRTILNSINIIDFLEDGETYTFSQSKANDKLYMQMNAKKKDGTYSYYSLNDSTKSKQEIIVNKSIYETYTLNIQTGLTSDWGDSPLTITNKYMLCKGTDTAATSFETYVGGQASPSPDYPQEIENIKGVENLFYNVVTNSTPSGITITQNDDGSLILNGTTTGVSIFDFKLPKALPAGTYTFSIEGSDNISNDVFLRARDNNGQMVTTDAQVQGNNTIQNSHTFTCEKEIVKVALNITTTGKTFNNFVIKPMLSKKKSNYVPFGSNYLQLEDKTENLIGLDNKQYRVNLKKGDKIIAVNNGTTNLNLNLYTNYGDITRNDFFTIAANSQRLIIIANDSHAIAWGGTLDNNAWVVKGEKFIPYEPYKEKIINVDLKGNNLCSNKDKSVKDELLVENGKAKIYKKIKEVVLNGTEGFAKTEEGFVLVTNDWGNKNKSATLSNYFTTYTNYSEFKEAKEGAGFLYENVNNFYIKIDGATTVNEFRAKLKSLCDSGNPVKVQYELAEPEVIDLGKIDFELLEGNSTLNLEEDLKSNISIKYYTDSTVVDLKKKVENKQNVILHGTTIPSNDLGEDGDIYLQHN